MKPLLIHHHLAKNAGSSLRRVIQANYRGDELFELYQATGERPRDWWPRWYASLDRAERARIRCVGSHSAQFLLPVVDDRPVRAFCMLRDPLDRVISLFRYSMDRGAAQAPRQPGPDRGGAEAIADTLRERGWSLADVYLHAGERSAPPALREVFWLFFDGQTRELLLPSMPADELPFRPDAATHQAALGEALHTLEAHYVVGTQDRFSQSVRLFADSFGWRKTFLPSANVGAWRRDGSGIQPIDATTQELILAHNKLDAELHARSSRRLAGLPETSRRGDVSRRVRRRLRGIEPAASR